MGRSIGRIDEETIRLTGNSRLKLDVNAQIDFLETSRLEGLIE